MVVSIHNSSKVKEIIELIIDKSWFYWLFVFEKVLARVKIRNSINLCCFCMLKSKVSRHNYLCMNWCTCYLSFYLSALGSSFFTAFVQISAWNLRSPEGPGRKNDETEGSTWFFQIISNLWLRNMQKSRGKRSDVRLMFCLIGWISGEN